jgi:6-phosphogluconolactonase (cycloisomerase 2 family)
MKCFDRRPLFRTAAIAILMAPAVACFSSGSDPVRADAGAQDTADQAAPVMPDAGADATVDADTPVDSGTIDANTVIDSGAGDASSPADSGAVEAAAPLPNNIYVASEQSGKLFAYATKANGDIGAQQAGSPFGTGGNQAYAVTGNRAGTRVYVSVAGATGAGSVAAFTLDANGNVSGTQAGSPFATGVTASPTRVVLNPAGTRLYVVHQGVSSGSIAVFAVDAAGNVGALRPGSPYGTGTGTYAASVNPAGTRLYVTSQEARAVFVFTLDANGDITGQSAGSPFHTGISDAPLLSVVHPSGAQLYVSDQDNDLVVFTLDANGDVTGQQAGSPFAATNSVGLAINAAGTRLYLGTNGSTIDVFTLDAATGALQGAAVPFTVGIGTYDLTENVAQSDLYVVDVNASQLASVALNANGAPQSAKSVSSPDGGLYPNSVYAR